MVDDGGWAEQDDEQRGRVSRVIITKVDNGGEQQLIDYDGVTDEKHTKVVRIQAFGFTNHPPSGSEGLLLTLNSRDTPVLLGIEHPGTRPTGDPSGTSRQYDGAGTTIYLDNAGNVHVEGSGTVFIKSAKVQIDAPQIIINGTITLKGDINQTGSITSTGAHKAAAHI